MATLVIRGKPIDATYLYLNIAWDIFVVAMWVVLTVITLRLRVKWRRRSTTDSFKRTMRFRMAHVYAIAAIFTVLGIDSTAIYFSEMNYINLAAIHEWGLVGTSFIIFFFFSHVETFFVAYKEAFDVPPWIATTRTAWLYVNAVVGNTLLIVHMSLQRRRLRSVTHIWVGSQLLLLGPVLFFITLRISESLKAHGEKRIGKRNQYAGGETGQEDLQKRIKRFQRFGLFTGMLMVAFGVAMMVVFAPRFGDPWSRRYHEGYNRDLRSEFFEFDVFRWVNFALVFYLIWIHWIGPQEDIESEHDSGSNSFRRSTSDKKRPTLTRARTTSRQHASLVTAAAADSSQVALVAATDGSQVALIKEDEGRVGAIVTRTRNQRSTVTAERDLAARHAYGRQQSPRSRGSQTTSSPSRSPRNYEASISSAVHDLEAQPRSRASSSAGVPNLDAPSPRSRASVSIAKMAEAHIRSRSETAVSARMPSRGSTVSVHVLSRASTVSVPVLARAQSTSRHSRSNACIVPGIISFDDVVSGVEVG